MFRVLGVEDDIVLAWQDWLWVLGELAIAAAIGLVVHWIVFGLALRAARRAGVELAHTAVKRIRRPLRLTFPLLAIQVVVPALV